jgi:hypothetical protein
METQLTHKNLAENVMRDHLLTLGYVMPKDTKYVVLVEYPKECPLLEEATYLINGDVLLHLTNIGANIKPHLLMEFGSGVHAETMYSFIKLHGSIGRLTGNDKEVMQSIGGLLETKIFVKVS